MIIGCSLCADGSCAGSCSYLVQCCRRGVFFPNSAVFTPILGISVRVSGIFALELEFLGCACGGLLAPSAYPTLRQSPSVAGLEVLRCGPPHWLSLRVCVGPF